MLGIQLKVLVDLQLTIQYFSLSLSLFPFLLLSCREKVLENMENMEKQLLAEAGTEGMFGMELLGVELTPSLEI